MRDKTIGIIALLNRRFPTSDWVATLQRGDEREILDGSLRAAEVVLGQFSPFNDLAQKTVVDLGCGSAGKSLYYATRHASEVIGVDVSIETSGAALREAKARGLNLRVMQVADGAPLPLGDESIDVVIASTVLEHIYDLDFSLRDVHRVLKPGGFFLNRWHPFRTRFGSHLHHMIGIPFAHLIFDERSLIRFYHAELLAQFGEVPPAFAGVVENAPLNDIMHLNRVTIADASRKFQAAGFRSMARRYFRGTTELKWALRLPVALRSFVCDYEVNILQKAKPT